MVAASAILKAGSRHSRRRVSNVSSSEREPFCRPPRWSAPLGSITSWYSFAQSSSGRVEEGSQRQSGNCDVSSILAHLFPPSLVCFYNENTNLIFEGSRGRRKVKNPLTPNQALQLQHPAGLPSSKSRSLFGHSVSTVQKMSECHVLGSMRACTLSCKMSDLGIEKRSSFLQRFNGLPQGVIIA